MLVIPVGKMRRHSSTTCAPLCSCALIGKVCHLSVPMKGWLVIPRPPEPCHDGGGGGSRTHIHLQQCITTRRIIMASALYAIEHCQMGPVSGVPNLCS